MVSTLSSKDCRLSGLVDSLCSPLLSPPCHRRRPPAGLPQQVLQLWHRSNWHWYLKAERRYACCAALRCAWDAHAPLLLHLAAADGLYQQVKW